MLLVDSLVVIGMSVVSLGTIHETDGIQEHTFCVRNAGERDVRLVQGYTSCGCTTIHFDQAATLQPGDTTRVMLRFNPRGKGGEFYESGTLVYRAATDETSSLRKRIQLALDGTCITSEETLLRQFPISLTDGLRLSANRFDLGRMTRGEKKERNVVILHRSDGDRQERIPVTFVVDDSMGKGIQHIARNITTRHKGKNYTFTVTFDVLIQ